MPDTTAEQRLEQLYQARIEYFRAYEACWRDAVTTSTSGDAFLNGVVFPDGTIVSSRPIEDGTYEVVSWNGTDAVNTAEVLTIANGIGTPSGISFAIKP